jgi:hypothetical protein
MAIFGGLHKLLGVAAVGVFATGLVAQQPPGSDPIAAARAQQKINDQKLGVTVAEALKSAELAAKNNPAKAAQILKAAQTEIDLAVGISGEARKLNTSVVQARLNGTDNRAPAVKPEADSVAKARRKTELDKYDAEIKAVRDGLKMIERYHEAGQYREAQGAVAMLAKQYPDNAAVLALQQKDTVTNNVAEARALTQLGGERYLQAMNAVQRSAIPANGDIEFPDKAKWAELTAKRVKNNQLTEKEKSVISALDKPMNATFNGQPLEEVLQRMSNMMDQNLFLDTKSLTDLGLDLKKPLTLDAKGVPARIVLRQLLAGQGLTFVVKDEIIQIVTVEKAREMLVTRVYYLGDIVKGIGTFGGLAWGPYIDQEQTRLNVKTIMDAITSSIDPLSWRGASGPGSITFDYLSMSLIVRASTEVHATLGAKIGAGR